MMATMLQVFDLRQRKDPSGKDIPLNIEWDDALVWYADSDLHYAVLLTIIIICGCSSSPLPFQCSITPRSEKTRKLVLNEHEKN